MDTLQKVNEITRLTNKAQLGAADEALRVVCQGKGRRHGPRKSRKLVLIIALCGIIGLGVGGPASGAGYDGNYRGKRTLTKGLGQNCPTEEEVSVSIKNNQLAFSRKNLQAIIGFVPSQEGSFAGTFEDMDGETLTLQGRIVGNVIDADAISKRCEHHWHLQRIR